MYLLGIDLGTTGCKAILFTKSGSIVSESYLEYPLIYKEEGYIEQDANLWWDLVKTVIKETVEKSTVHKDKIIAISISSQGIAFVPVDEAGKTLYNAISWLDTRANKQTAYIRKKIGDKEIFDRTGKIISPSYTLPKIMWLKEEKNEIYEKAWKILMGLDFITYKLTGKIITDHSMASGTMAYDITKRQWDSEILDICGIDENKLPEIKYMGTNVGNLLDTVAYEIGLSPNLEVILGAQDQKCAAIGAGIKEGICTVSLGTATAISTIGSEPMLDQQMRIPCFVLDEGRWALEAVIATSGVSLKWLKNTFFNDKTYGQLDEIVETVLIGAGNVFFYPHFVGAASPYWKAETKGFIYGIGLATTSGEILRALYEGLAFQIKSNIEILEQLGSKIDEIHVFGGGSKSNVWCRIIADVTGKIVNALFTSETANLGAAMIAGVGSGVYKDYSDFTKDIKLVKERYKPDVSTFEKYNSIFENYLEIQKRIMG